MNMHEMNMWLTDAATVVVGADGLDVVPMASQQCWGCHCCQARHNASNVGGVTAGQLGHNSSINKLKK